MKQSRLAAVGTDCLASYTNKSAERTITANSLKMKHPELMMHDCHALQRCAGLIWCAASKRD
jgi:hypothetical protein